MPTTKKPTAKKQPAKRISAEKAQKRTSSAGKKRRLFGWFFRMRDRARGLLARRPHRSFRRTRRRDYVRSLKLPGYWAFTNSVRKTLWQNKKLFLLLALTYAVLTAALVGAASQSTYERLSDTLDQANENLLDGDLGGVGRAGLLLTTGMVGAFNQTPTDTQRIFAALLGLLVWLTTVWLLRTILAGRKPKLRDGLYSAGAPTISTLLVSCLVVLQLLPVALAAIGFDAASRTGLLNGGVEAMLFWMVAGLLTLLSVYWITSSAIAMVVVTLPGMYPSQAIKTAGDLVVGRRVRILLRLLWGTIIALVGWALVMIPVILLDSWLKDTWHAMEWLPIVPIALLAMGALSVVWAASYVYLLYRRIVDDDAAPA